LLGGRVAEEAHGAIGQRSVHAIGMVAARGKHRERRPAGALAGSDNIDIWFASTRRHLIRRPGGNEAVVLHRHFRTLRMSGEDQSTAAAGALRSLGQGAASGPGSVSGSLMVLKPPQSRVID